MTTDQILTIALAILSGLAAICTPLERPARAAPTARLTMNFDVAEDKSRLTSLEKQADGLPATGRSFTTRGYLYTVGTLDSSNGLNPDGSPAFPNKIIGKWIRQAHIINEPGRTLDGIRVFSTHYFQFGDDLDAETIITQGYELANFKVTTARAITGGSGEYSRAWGHATHTRLGLNVTEGVNLRVHIQIEK